MEGDALMDLDQAYVWITTRRLKPGTREDFSRAWRPSTFPEGMLRAYECYSPDGNEVVGISIWDSPEARERFRLSEVESERRRAMAPFVLEERAGFYIGRELKIPSR
jgi:heme-degrading monooxygenase HmoA